MNLNIIIAALSLFFLFASSIKILGWQKMIFETQLAMFIKYGLNRKVMMLTGFVELFGSIAIWFQASWIGPLGALALFGTSIGAIFCHLVWDTWKESVPAMITAMLSIFVVWIGREPLLSIINYLG
jgi:hypothetical protein